MEKPPVITVLRRLRQENQELKLALAHSEFEANLDYMRLNKSTTKLGHSLEKTRQSPRVTRGACLEKDQC